MKGMQPRPRTGTVPVTMSKNENSPYKGQLLTVLFLVGPPLILFLMFYAVFTTWQPRYSNELHLASAKMFGCGVGSLFHCCYWITGAFKKERRIVVDRLKELFADLPVSIKMAFTWYWDDLKTNGITYWIDVGIILLNLILCITGTVDVIDMIY